MVEKPKIEYPIQNLIFESFITEPTHQWSIVVRDRVD